MAILFLLMSISIGSIFFRKRKISYLLFALILIGSMIMLWHHITETLKINL